MSSLLRRGAGIGAVVLALTGGGVLGHALSRSRSLERAAGFPSPGGVARSAQSATHRTLSGKVQPPPAGALYWGIYRDGAPYRTSLVGSLEREVGATPALLMWYQEWNGQADFPTEQAAWLRDRGIVPVISWEPWRPPQVFGDLAVDQPSYRLSRIAAGAFDPYIRRYARDIRAYGGPVLLRPFHEMDGFWYPWGGMVNGNTPSDFVRAWRHIHDIFRAAGATNVAWIWSVNHVSVPATPANDFSVYWPGKSYVDWVGISGFNWGRASPLSVWKGIDRVIGARYQALARYDKPVALMETGAPEAGGDKAAWIRATFATLLRSFPNLRALIWYDKRDSPLRDWRIDSSPRALAAFRAVVANPLVLGSDAAESSALDASTPVSIRDGFDRRASGTWGGVAAAHWQAYLTAGRAPSLSVDGVAGVARASGLSKSVMLIGPDTGRNVRVTATLTTVATSAGIAANHWQILARAGGARTYYALQFYPVAPKVASLKIFRAVGGHFADLAESPAGFGVQAGRAYHVEIVARTTLAGVRIVARVWPAGTPRPARWSITMLDSSKDQILSGRAGIRFSFYSGPDEMIVDEFEVDDV